MTYYTAELQTVCFKVREDANAAPADIVQTPPAAVHVLRAIFETLDADRENCVLLALSMSNAVRGFKVVSIGGTGEAVADPRTIIRDLIALGAAAFILCHNHPTGDPYPSQADRNTTTRLAALGVLLAVPLVDHVILGAGGTYFSFSERGALPQLSSRDNPRALFELTAGVA